MKILVTGGCGFIGTNLCLSLKAKGYKITALDNFSKDGSKENANILNRSKIPIWGNDLIKQFPKE